jgi:hypothetical protein
MVRIVKRLHVAQAFRLQRVAKALLLQAGTPALLFSERPNF